MNGNDAINRWQNGGPTQAAIIQKLDKWQVLQKAMAEFKNALVLQVERTNLAMNFIHFDPETRAHMLGEYFGGLGYGNKLVATAANKIVEAIENLPISEGGPEQ